MGISIVGGQFLEGNQLCKFPAGGFPLSSLFSLSFREWISAIEYLDFIFIGGCAGFFQVELRVAPQTHLPAFAVQLKAEYPGFSS
ncbi:hypothetical protein D3C75_1106830 [compost metagenome]